LIGDGFQRRQNLRIDPDPGSALVATERDVDVFAIMFGNYESVALDTAFDLGSAGQVRVSAVAVSSTRGLPTLDLEIGAGGRF
jgi:hypothetical protein